MRGRHQPSFVFIGDGGGMRDETLRKVRNYIREHDMLQQGDTVCIGLSGGADSVCLMVMLDALSKELGIRITAFHVNHCLRGEESDGDEAFVRELCAARSIPLKVFRYDIAAAAAERKKGLEETGRLMRREAAREAAGLFRAEKVALAHHANDSAETVLFNLVRGSSAGGLRGILPVNGRVIRPLLRLEKTEITAELERRGIVWREDRTNASAEYSRNLLRNIILPELAEKINAGAVRHINEAARDCAEAFEMVNKAARERLEHYSEWTGEGLLLKNGILTGKRLIDGRIALCAIECVTQSAVDLTRSHARELAALFEKQTGRVIRLPCKTEAGRVYEGVLIRKKRAEENPENDPGKPLPEGGMLEYGGLFIRTEIINSTEIPYKIPEKRYTKWFDYDKIGGCGTIRHGRPEDHIVINSEGGRKKLKKFFTDEKIPRDERKKAVCLAVGEELLWIIGYRMGESAKITGNTKRALRIDITGETV